MSGGSTDFETAFRVLAFHGVEYILVGGVAAALHGSARTTFDLDIVYARNEANLGRLVDALSSHAPYLRGAPPGLPFRWDERTVRAGLNFTLITDFGPIDLLGEVAGGGTYASLLSESDEIEAFGQRIRRVRLARLIELKRAAGRPKDLEAIAELESLREERDRGGDR